jgi:hypothetical protein
VAYVDAVSDAVSGFADEPPGLVGVFFEDDADQQLKQLPDGESLKTLIEQTLGLDPRPAYKKNKTDAQVYGTALVFGMSDGGWSLSTSVCYHSNLIL